MAGPKKQEPSAPPSKLKLAKALKILLEEKSFAAITTAEISRTAGVNEALIYRHFKDKRGVLHHVLHDYMVAFQTEINRQLKTTSGALNKLRVLIKEQIRMYDTNRVFAKILLLEVRNFPGYFESDTYQLVKSHGRFLTAIINEGVEAGEIRDDIPLSRMRNLVLGGIEHFSMSPVIFGHPMDVESVGEDLCELIFSGLQRRP
ncbi:MAG: TetR/AcrR family transcriptional regulator [Desulfobacterales bacterium]|nr:TetR/AcrR family transcriptional regulator [Desulfobacterales bacterium]